MMMSRVQHSARVQLIECLTLCVAWMKLKSSDTKMKLQWHLKLD